jgi:hypothetical protein
MLTLVQLHTLYISRIPGMDGICNLRSIVSAHHFMDESFTRKGQELLPISSDSA